MFSYIDGIIIIIIYIIISLMVQQTKGLLVTSTNTLVGTLLTYIASYLSTQLL